MKLHAQKLQSLNVSSSLCMHTLVLELYSCNHCRRGQASLAFLVLTFKIIELYFWFCCNASFEVIYFVVVLSIGYVGARLDQAWLWHKS